MLQKKLPVKILAQISSVEGGGSWGVGGQEDKIVFGIKLLVCDNNTNIGTRIKYAEFNADTFNPFLKFVSTSSLHAHLY